MYLIISTSLILLTFFLTFWERLKAFRNKYPEFFNFSITLVATFVGVFLAIDFTNKSEYKKEEVNLIKLLNASVMDLNLKVKKTEIIYTLVKFGSDSIYSARLHLKNNPMQLSNLFQSLVINEVVLRHLSPQGIQEFTNCADNLLSLQTSINEGKAQKDSILVATVMVYIKQLEFAKKIIAIEVGRMEGHISDKYLEQHYSEAETELVGNGTHDIENAIDEQKKREKVIQ